MTAAAIASVKVQRDVDFALDDLLSRWHDWQHGARIERGFNQRSTVTGDYLVSRQYDDANGALDDAIDDGRSRIVDYHVQEMLHPWRTAIYVLARNLNAGINVWNSPRLPTDKAELAAIIREARHQLTVRLSRAGVL